MQGLLHTRYIGIADICLVKVLAEVTHTRVSEEEEVQLQKEPLLDGWLIGIVPDISLDAAPGSKGSGSESRLLPHRGIAGWGRGRIVMAVGDRISQLPLFIL